MYNGFNGKNKKVFLKVKNGKWTEKRWEQKNNERKRPQPSKIYQMDVITHHTYLKQSKIFRKRERECGKEQGLRCRRSSKSE